MLESKLKAMLFHGLITVMVAVVLSVLVFYYWFPGELSKIMPGTKLFVLILVVEVVLGPCMSLILFSPLKSRRELIIDYGLVVVVQLFALVYGVVSVVNSRPAYVVFVKDRFEVVAAVEVAKNDLSESSDKKLQGLSWGGPEYICVKSVVDSKERERLLFEEYAQGRDVQHLPRFYRDCEEGEIYGHAYDFEKLLPIIEKKQSQNLFKDLVSNGKFKWIPLHGKRGIWVAVMQSGSNKPVRLIQFDPY